MADDWRETAGPPCPVCWHEETMRAQREDREPADTTPEMRLDWRPPIGGARGQQATRGDGGYWRCPGCGVVLTPREAAVLLDAITGDRPWVDQAARGGKHG